ncbi:MAG: VTC domain-containing protein, partial [Solobacterium sp.]|nr:VTC domain-containing protein [Solobacterium sp.]
GNTAEEIDYMMNYYHLEPAVLILYDRECWSSDTEKDVRITFDSNIRYRLDNVTLKETGEEKPLRKGMVIMEVKAMDRYPLWLVRILSENKLYKSSFSKYGTIYTETYGRPQNRTGRAYEYTGEKEKRLCSVQY